MSDNIHAKPLESLSETLCAACRLPASPNSEGVIMEVGKGWTPQGAVCLVWHRCCYDEFLDQGEES